MYWATTTFSVTATIPELTAALQAWKQHIDEAHPLIKAVRCYRFDGERALFGRRDLRISTTTRL